MLFLFLSVLPLYTLLPWVPLFAAGVWVSVEVWLEEFNSLELILLLLSLSAGVRGQRSRSGRNGDLGSRDLWGPSIQPSKTHCNLQIITSGCWLWKMMCRLHSAGRLLQCALTRLLHIKAGCRDAATSRAWIGELSLLCQEQDSFSKLSRSCLGCLLLFCWLLC